MSIAVVLLTGLGLVVSALNDEARERFGDIVGQPLAELAVGPIADLLPLARAVAADGIPRACRVLNLGELRDITCVRRTDGLIGLASRRSALVVARSQQWSRDPASEAASRAPRSRVA